MKRSITGFLGMQRENERFENNLETTIGNLYYSKDSGFKWDNLNSQNADISSQTLNTWIIGEAAEKGIVVLSSETRLINNKLSISYQIAGADSGSANI